jgi:predicted small secreted protein
MKRSIALILLMLFSIGILTACNTVEGAGKDVQKAGEKVQDAADKDN